MTASCGARPTFMKPGCRFSEIARHWCTERYLSLIHIFEESIKAEVGVEHEGSAVIAIVAHKQISHRRLRGGGLERGVGVDHAGGGVEAGIGDAHDAGLAVVAGHVVEKEFERVVHVGTVVDIFGRFFYIDVRAHLDEGASGHVAAADILVHKDIAGFLKFIRWAEALRILVFAVRGDVVRRPGNEEGVCLAAVLRHVDGSEEMHAVAHGDAVLVFRVVGLDIVLFRRGGRGLCGRGVRGQGSGAEQKYPAESYGWESPFRH